MRLSIDVGHGYTKALAETGERVLFPSLIAYAPTGPDLGRFGGRDTVRIDGVEYLVGETASLSATSLFSRDKSTDALTVALTKIAAARLAGPGYHTVSLGVGLPLSWYADQKDALAAVIRGTADLGDTHLLVEQVSVFPQGIGALVSIEDLPWTGLVGLVDVGYRTVDYVVADVRDGLPMPLTAYAGTYAGGMHGAYQAMSQAVERETGVRYAPHELINRESIAIRGQRMTLSALAATAFETLAGDLTRHVASRWDGLIDKVDRLYLAGGGAVSLLPLLSGLPAAQVLSDSQWANARGFLSLM